MLAKPGTTSYVLQVNNTGNTQDAYTATITGTSGPITANLIGLDGQPTQSIPIFYLPGLSTDALVVQTTSTGAGKGSIAIDVHSLSNNAACHGHTDHSRAKPLALAFAVPLAVPVALTFSFAFTRAGPWVDSCSVHPHRPVLPAGAGGTQLGLRFAGLMATVALYSNGNLYLMLPGFTVLIDTGVNAAELYTDAQGNIGLCVVLQGSERLPSPSTPRACTSSARVCSTSVWALARAGRRSLLILRH